MKRNAPKAKKHKKKSVKVRKAKSVKKLKTMVVKKPLKKKVQKKVKATPPVVQVNSNHSPAQDQLLANVNQELYKRNAELSFRNKTLALLRKLDEISMTSLGMEEMAKEVTAVICQELGYEIVSVGVIKGTNSKSVLSWLASSSTVPAMLSALRKNSNTHVETELMNTPIQDAISKKAPVVVNGFKSIYPLVLTEAIAPITSLRPLSHTLLYPLWLGDQALGVLVLSASRNLHDLSRYERESLDGIIGLVSLSIFKAKIYEDLQKMTSDLQEANEKLAKLDKAKSEFLSIASHQLYTPLTAIKGYLSMIQEGDFGPVSEKQHPVIDILRQSSDRLIELIKNLLDISRIESGRLELSLISLDLVGMARELVTELSPNAKKKNLVLNFHEPPSALPHTVADQQRVRQVLLNTVDNAIKYTPQGSIDVSVVQQDKYLIFSVKDTGKGIKAEEINQLFSKFVRVGGADHFHTDGSGLGLYVARQIVREHRGDIWVESPGEGKGSTFFVKLPIEGTVEELKAGQNITVGIKAAEVGQKSKG